MHPIPIRHAMTIGELAYMINESGWLEDSGKVSLNIIKMQGWDRSIFYENTGKSWISPSPNIANNQTSFIYSGTCLIEGTNLSEGRGTDNPFIYLGSPWLDTKKLIYELNNLQLQGVEFSKVSFTPRFLPSKAEYPKYKDQKCYGIKINIIDRKIANPLLITTHIINIVSKNHPNDFKFISNNFIDKLYGSDKLRNTITQNSSIDKLFEDWDRDQVIFSNLRQRYLLYK